VSKPEAYPLPWCDALDMPYWQLNLMMVGRRPGWGAWQAHKPMAEIIPEIDRMLRGDGA